jgi:hypothetical protein
MLKSCISHCVEHVAEHNENTIFYRHIVAIMCFYVIFVDMIPFFTIQPVCNEDIKNVVKRVNNTILQYIS